MLRGIDPIRRGNLAVPLTLPHVVAPAFLSFGRRTTRQQPLLLRELVPSPGPPGGVLAVPAVDCSLQFCVACIERNADASEANCAVIGECLRGRLNNGESLGEQICGLDLRVTDAIASFSGPALEFTSVFTGDWRS